MMTEIEKRPRDRASWDQRYVQDELPWDSGIPDPHLRAVIDGHGIDLGQALEIGCGTGTNVIWLAERGFNVTGLDLSKTAIARAEVKVAAADVSCALSASDFLVDEVSGGPFDFIYDRGCFHVFDEAEKRSIFASRVADLLAPEGIWHSLIGSTDGPPRDTGPPRHNAIEIAKAVEPHFEILDLKSTTFDRDTHSQIKAWVLVARRRTFYADRSSEG